MKFLIFEILNKKKAVKSRQKLGHFIAPNDQTWCQGFTAGAVWCDCLKNEFLSQKTIKKWPKNGSFLPIFTKI